MYQTFLAEIAEQQQLYGEQMQPPCSVQELQHLTAQVLAEFQVALPKGYLDFLSQMNGLDWNGLSMYAAERVQIVGSESAFIPGFVEMNTVLRDDPFYQDFLVFGHGNLDVYGWRVSTQEFQAYERAPHNLVGTFPSFDALLASALEAHL